MGKVAKSIAEVVTNGLCIGCGLCEAVTHGRVRMVMTDTGALRPTPADAFEAEEEKRLLAACPGVAVEPRPMEAPRNDLVWGGYSSLAYAWAGDPELRFRAATGGVLSALAVHLLKSRQVDFVLQVEADPKAPMRSRWTLSETPEAASAAAGSRYGPVAPLAGLMAALERGQPFALVAKPCDLSAVHRLSKVDERVDRLCRFRLVLVCGGQSRLGKSRDLLQDYGLSEDEVTLFRYRGHGNPGVTRVETRDGRAFEKTYREMWEDEAGWQLESRCKLCPDALGEAADIAALDVWPDASPSGEDAGFNGIVVRSAAGEALVASAVAAGDLVLGEALTAAELTAFQPHQLRKKQALKARTEGLAQAGMPLLAAPGLRLDALAAAAAPESQARERDGALLRARQGRFSEPLPGEGGET